MIPGSNTPIPRANFEFSASTIFGRGPTAPPPVSGNAAIGIPGNNGVGSVFDVNPGDSANAAIDQGKALAASPPTRQPVFWYVVLMVVAVVMLAHVARVGVNG